MLRSSVYIFLHLAASVAVPVPCGEQVARLEAEIRRLISVVTEQHQYIQELHSTQAKQLQHIPHSLLQRDTAYRDCSDIFADGNLASGLYVIRPDGAPSALNVYCDMNNGGGWTVFQRRRDGKENFDRAWVEYKHGFGDMFSPSGEFWLGNDPLHYLTSQGNHELRIDMEDFEGNRRFAEYKKFKVDNEEDQYQLHLGQYSGNAGDAFAAAEPFPDGVKFSTFDHQNYPDDDVTCAQHDMSGWWFSRCGAGNLNGHYHSGPYQAMTDDGVVWYTWRGWWYSIKSVVMMVRAADVEPPPPQVHSSLRFDQSKTNVNS